MKEETNAPVQDLLGIVEAITFTPDNAKFHATAHGFLALEANIPPVKKDDLEQESTDTDQTPRWQELGRVYLHRAFPFDKPDEFISVLNKDNKEYGVIRRLQDFPEGSEARALLDNELARKYYTPCITAIHSLKERFGYSYWEVDTDRGPMKFAMHDTFRNIARISEGRLSITDVDGNRFEITDVFALDRSSFRRIELYL